MSPSILASVRQAAKAAHCTPFTVFACAFHILLQRYTGQEDVAFATPVSRRTHPDARDMVGYFLNPVVVRAHVDPDQGVGDAISAMSETLTGAYDHAGIPFDVLVRDLSPKRRQDRHPLFRFMLVHQRLEPAPVLNGVTLEPVQLDLGVAKFDLTLFISESEQGFSIGVEYRTDCFDPIGIESVLSH